MSSGELLPAYLVVGSDEFKRSHVINKMKARLEASGLSDFNLDERDMTKDPQVDDIIASLNTLPFGTDFRLVILHGCDRLSKSVSEPLVEYLANPSPTTVCMIEAEKLAKNTRLYKAIAKVGARSVIDCAPMKARELPGYVVKQATKYGKSITYDAAEALVSRAGENTRMLDSHLKKLSQMLSGSTIELADVESHVVRTAEAKPWDFLDAVSDRNMVRALELYALQPSRSEVRLFSLLVGRLRELITAKALDARGEGKQLAAALGLQGWQVRNHIRWSRKYKMSELIGALDRAVETELALKGSRDSDVAMRMFIISIIQQ